MYQSLLPYLRFILPLFSFIMKYDEIFTSIFFLHDAVMPKYKSIPNSSTHPLHIYSLISLCLHKLSLRFFKDVPWPIKEFDNFPPNVNE